ncbi:3-oxoacyl-ACP reductase (plasmid) [Alloyangia pacifica]|uniref:3-oxoacyl-ACP reductase n=1 Tax=Alloyangia pacifica TaxID=311180 RepID=A0A2U8HML0_9RHOB|nr:SDR family NAD(P)-dependent oxidoreductase [Alloyangia pacifica]AWI86780.1 3-oxoacyl-ACP reductase [Alloyangia pacifica]
MNAIDLQDRVAVITGGCGGIGAAVRARFQASGATALSWDIDKAADAQIDCTDETSVDKALQATLSRFRRIDILVNAAGITGHTLPIEDYSLREWRRTLDINLTGTFLCCRAVVPSMRARNYGRIVNLASVAGKEGNPAMVAYSAAKGGVIALTKALAKELTDTDIRVNSVAPAIIETDLIKQMAPEIRKAMIAKIPLDRLGRPEEVASMIAWLSSEECSFSTGACFDLSGGRATY